MTYKEEEDVCSSVISVNILSVCEHSSELCSLAQVCIVMEYLSNTAHHWSLCWALSQSSQVKDRTLCMYTDFCVWLALHVITNKILGFTYLSLVYIYATNNKSKYRPFFFIFWYFLWIDSLSIAGKGNPASWFI